MPEPAAPAFISYSREDSQFALRLAQDLKAAGASVWLDQLDIAPGAPWDNAIEEALIAAPQMMLILSPSSSRSDNVRNEISFALEAGKVIIPVLYRDCVVPLRLQRIQRIDFRADYAGALAKLLAHLQVSNPDPGVMRQAAERGAAQSRPTGAKLFWLLRVNRAYWLAAAAVVAILAIATIYWLPRYAESVYQQALLFKLHSDYIDAARMMNRACGLGERRACTSLGLLYVGGHGASTDPKQAARLFQKSCDGGDFDGCTQLGSLYESGNGVPKNTKTAADLYRQGCDGGDAEGCTALGLLYDGGDGVPKDPKQAAAYFQRACDDDDSSGCNFLGVDYESGSDGLPKDAQKAFANYKKACDGGYIRACGSLSFLYQAGPETLQNQKLAVELGQKSCDADIENGCIVMGNYYHIHADTIDDTKAKIYYNKACSLGAETACKYVKGIK